MKTLIISTLIIFSNISYASVYILSRTIGPAANTCELALAGYDLAYSIEWRYSPQSPIWMSSTENKSALVSNCNNKISCKIRGGNAQFENGKTYYFAARQYIDINHNNELDSADFYQDWSPASLTSNEYDFIHACAFN
ncbi:MAG: hypothetical protein V4654_01830 [Bdellovibrionota bacterium]